MTYTEQGPFIDVPFAQWNSPPAGAKAIDADAANAFDQGIKDAHDLIAAGSAPTLSNIPAGSVLYVNQNGDGTWPNRLTSRTDVKTIWTKIVAGSADPASATSPAVNGAYANDVAFGV